MASHCELSKLKLAHKVQFIFLHKCLDIGDLKDVIEALKQGYFPSHRWFSFGLQLNLLHPTLAEIEANHKDDVGRCLQECLTLWLSKADKVTESGGPTWDSLAVALNKIGENATAEKVKEYSEYTLNMHVIHLILLK